MAQVGIIIVTYNSADEIGACLDAALATGAEIAVVDNASADASVRVAAARGVRVIANSENRGFAAAVNQGFAVLNHPYILVLNPDTVIQGGLDELRAACDLPDSAGSGGKLLGPDGLPQIGFMARSLPTPAALIMESLLLNRLWPQNPVNRRYRGLGWDYTKQFAVEQPAGAFLMVRRDVWARLGGFDEGFFPLWFEDVDFCRRIQQQGLILYYVPGAVAKHTGGHSIPSLAVEKRPVYWYRSLLRYSAKNFGTPGFRAVCGGVLLGCVLRGVGESVWRRSLKPIAAYALVARLAVRCLCFGFPL
jgi:GT2 family glycosyltransferase